MKESHNPGKKLSEEDRIKFGNVYRRKQNKLPSPKKNTHLPECDNCTRQYEKWCSYFEAKHTCDYKQYLENRREPFKET